MVVACKIPEGLGRRSRAVCVPVNGVVRCAANCVLRQTGSLRAGSWQLATKYLRKKVVACRKDSVEFSRRNVRTVSARDYDVDESSAQGNINSRKPSLDGERAFRSCLLSNASKSSFSASAGRPAAVLKPTTCRLLRISASSNHDHSCQRFNTWRPESIAAAARYLPHAAPCVLASSETPRAIESRECCPAMLR